MHRGTLLSNDIKKLFPPWAPFYPEKPVGRLISDPVYQFVPWADFARRELRAGRLPLWNPHQDGGVPLLGNMQSALGSPLIWPVLAFGPRPGWNLSLLFRILLALCGAFLWLRDLGRSRPAAALGAIAFALSAPFVAWLEHPQTSTAAAIPLLLMFAARSARDSRPRNVAGLAIATFLTLAGGHPETQLMAALLALAVVGFEARSPRAALAPGLGAVLGAGLAAPFLLPFLEYYRAGQARLGIDRAPFTIPWSDLRAFLVGRFRETNIVESAAAVSIPVLLLAFVGLAAGFRRRDVRFWGGIALACVLVTYENPLARFLAVSTSIHWTRALLVLPLALGYLAACGADSIRTRLERAGRTGLAAVLGAAFVAASATELLLSAHGWHMLTRAPVLSPRTPLLARLAQDRDVFRILALHSVLAPNTATDYELDDVRGYDAIAPRGWRQRRAEIGRFGNARFQMDVLEPWDLTPGGRGLDFWNVKYLILDPRFAFGAEVLNEKRGLDLEQVYAGPDGRLLRNRRVLARARVEGGRGTVSIAEHLPRRWLLEATLQTSGTLVMANPAFPGWEARVDRRRVPIEAEPGDAIKIPLPAGEHRIELLYRPASFRAGVWAALGAVLALSAVGLRGRG